MSDVRCYLRNRNQPIGITTGQYESIYALRYEDCLSSNPHPEQLQQLVMHGILGTARSRQLGSGWAIQVKAHHLPSRFSANRFQDDPRVRAAVY